MQLWKMSLNIKSAEAHELARRLAALTGESLTAAVTQALRERLERLAYTTDPDAKARELLRIGRRAKAAMPGAPMDHAEFLYDH